MTFSTYSVLWGGGGGWGRGGREGSSVIVVFSEHPLNYFLMPNHRIIELFSIHR